MDPQLNVLMFRLASFVFLGVFLVKLTSDNAIILEYFVLMVEKVDIN